MMDIASGQAFGREYIAWKDLFFSLKQPYSCMVFLSGTELAKINRFAERALSAAQLQFGLDSTLAVITDYEPTRHVKMSTAEHTRTLSRLNPKLTESERANILTWLIYYLRPQAVINVDSATMWRATAERGRALKTVSRLFATIFSDLFAGSDNVLDNDIRKASPYLTGFYAPSRELKRAFVGHLDAASFLQSLAFKPIQRRQSANRDKDMPYVAIPGVRLYCNKTIVEPSAA
jgi:hypothetical protein